MLSESATYAESSRMAKRQRLYAPAAGPAIRPAAAAAIPKRSHAIAARSPGRCSNASTCISTCRDCRPPNCAPTHPRANPATSSAPASSVRAKCSDNAPAAATRIWINPKRTRCAGSRPMINPCWRTRSTCCNSRRVRCTESSAWPAPSPTSPEVPISSARTLRKPSVIGAGRGRLRQGQHEEVLTKIALTLLFETLEAWPSDMIVLKNT